MDNQPVTPPVTETTAPVVPSGPETPALVPNPMDPPPAPDPLEGTPYNSVEDLIAGNKALQAKHTQVSQELAQLRGQKAPQGETPEVEETSGGAEPAPEPTWDWNTTFEYFDNEKGWDDKAVSHFESIGIPKDVLNDIGTLKQQRDEFASKLFTMQAEQMVGGAETLEQVLTFIGEHMPQVANDIQDPNKFEYVIEAAVSRMKREGALGGETTPAPAEASPAPDATNVRGQSADVLIPGSPEAMIATSDPRMRYDMNYAQRVRDALARGTK